MHRGLTISIFALAASMAAASEQLDITDQIRRDLGFNLYPRVGATNLQAFSGALGGVSASAISNSGDADRPFQVDGDTFTDYQSAANRACDNQKNNCADLANNGQANFEVGDCDQQNEQCKSAASTATQTAFQELVSSNAEFDFICDVS